MKVPVRRCALYTRKSSEEGLEQNFNSLLAQREACAAYVKSQASEGWRALEARYDDGGFSGGSMERPALQRLLADIAVGKVDVVVVYKIDRLTRALTDFARMVEIFDRHEVSFVSVTQAFNTTSSMGRLTLNVLLSFAQFEREVTGERIRDKIAASKARGMWMGGNLPLGYNLPVEGQRALVLNEAEAETVQAIFMKYRELGSVRALQHWLVAQGIHSKRRTTASGRTIGGDPFTRGALFYMLRNRTYLGMIVHRDKLHAGMHPAIVDADLFEAVQRQLDVNARQRRMRGNQHPPAPLKGRVFDADGRAMSPTFAYGQQKKCYRYYASPAPQLGRRADRDRTIRRIPAQALEAKLAEIVRRVASAGPSDPLSLLTRVEVYPDALHLLMPIDLLPAMRNRIMQDERLDRDLTDPTQLRLMLPVRLQFHGGRTRIISGAEPGGRPDPVLVKALRAAHAMLGRDAAGHPVLAGAPASTYHRRLLRLAFLAPELQRAIFSGRQPVGMTLAALMDARLPLLWTEQIDAFEAAGPA
jgi:site-specific DNA recombinase